MKTEIFNYQGNNISFQFGNGDVMINATEMAKQFDKRPNDFLNLSSTEEFIKVITNKNGIAQNQVIKTIRGGNNSGTWMCEDLALEFARWLSVEFRVWCNNRIKELLKNGYTQLQPKSTLDLLKLAVSDLEQKERENLLLSNENKQLKPKADLMDKVLATDQKIDVGQAAKILNLPFGRNTLFKKLREKGIFFKNRNEPKQEFITKGYFFLKETYIEAQNMVVIKVLVSQQGLSYINKIFSPEPTDKQLALIK